MKTDRLSRQAARSLSRKIYVRPQTFLLDGAILKALIGSYSRNHIMGCHKLASPILEMTRTDVVSHGWHKNKA